jgi:AcrR family transcriptional regulator
VKISPQSNPEQLRILEAFIATVAERGYLATSMTTVLAEAEVDEATFRRHFEDKEECFLAAWDYITASYLPVVMEAYETKSTWRERMRAVGLALVDYMMEHPDHARILFVESLLPGDRAWALLDRNIAFFVELIDLGRQEMDDPEALTRATAEGLAGAVHEQMALILTRGEDDTLPSLVGPLMYLVVRPYLGDEVAREELLRS